MYFRAIQRCDVCGASGEAGRRKEEKLEMAGQGAPRARRHVFSFRFWLTLACLRGPYAVGVSLAGTATQWLKDMTVPRICFWEEFVPIPCLLYRWASQRAGRLSPSPASSRLRILEKCYGGPSKQARGNCVVLGQLHVSCCSRDYGSHDDTEP